MKTRKVVIWSFIMALLCFLIYANLEIRAYNKLVVGLAKVNQAILGQINSPDEIMTKRFEASLGKQFPGRVPREVAIDILNFLEIIGPPIQQVQKKDSLWIVQVKTNNRAITFCLLEGNNSVRLDSCTNINYICRKMAFKSRMKSKRTLGVQ